jgi:hypothetical protein
MKGFNVMALVNLCKMGMSSNHIKTEKEEFYTLEYSEF